MDERAVQGAIECLALPELAVAAADALGKIRFDAYQAVSPATIREMADGADVLIPFLIHPERFQAWMAIPFLGPHARAALPEFRYKLYAPLGPRALGATAALAIWRIERDPDVIRPLVGLVGREPGYNENCEYVAYALGQIGEPARAAIPLLARAVFQDRGSVSIAAAAAMEQIEPGSCIKWGIPPRP